MLSCLIKEEKILRCRKFAPFQIKYVYENQLVLTALHLFSAIVSASYDVDEHEQPNASEARPVPELSSAHSDNDDNDEKNEHAQPRTPPVIRKDAFYQGSLENIPLYKENIKEYHRQIIVSHETTNQSDSTAHAGDVKVKGFFSELKGEIGIKFLADNAFLLFTISNFMTSLGFNVPYNFAHDLAKDAKVVEHHREYVIMSIGLSNALGRIIIGYLGDRKAVFIIFICFSCME
jgi:hypothetical protein